MQVQPKELERLAEKFVGKWKIDLTIKMPDGSTLKGKGTAECKQLSLGRGVYSAVRLNVEGMGQYDEDDLWGFDQWTKKMHFYAIASSGALHDHVGMWKDESTLEFHWEGIYEGKPAAEDVVFRWVSDKELHVHEVDTSDGQPSMTMDYVCRK